MLMSCVGVAACIDVEPRVRRSFSMKNKYKVDEVMEEVDELLKNEVNG